MLQDSDDIEDIELSELLDEKLISKLESLKTKTSLHKGYAEIYAGGVYALRHRNRRENPDWMSQSANSFREILYILQKTEVKTLQLVLNEYFAKSLTQEEVNEYRLYLANLYDFFSGLAHHFSEISDISKKVYLVKKDVEIGINPLTEENYFKAITYYKEYLKILVVTSLDLHEKIDECITASNQDKELVGIFFKNSRDSKIYFLSKIDESWLDWLWNNGFLLAIYKEAEKISYRLPELEYLERMALIVPFNVAKIINSVKISEVKFNPEVIDRFIWMIGGFPANVIKGLTSKIRDEKWVYLTRDFRRSGYEFERILKPLTNNNEDNAILELAEAMLAIKDKAEVLKNVDEPFCLSELSGSGVFDALKGLQSKREQALQLLTGIVSELIKLSDFDETKVFTYADVFSLFDVDLFTVKVKNKDYDDYHVDVKNLVATIKELMEAEMSMKCGNEEESRRLFEYINKMPLCRFVWRLRLYTLAQCPELFIGELKDAFFRLFDVENYYEIEGGTEYKKALKIAFPFMQEIDRRDFVEKVFDYFSKRMEQSPTEPWHKRTGLEILSVICSHLTADELEKCEKLFGDKCDPTYIPEPTMRPMISGLVKHKSPVELGDYSMSEIIQNLKSEWTVKNLKQTFESDDFLSPRGPEGLGEALKEDLKKRSNDYLESIKLFFDRNNIHSSYVYFILRGIEELFKDKSALSLHNIGKILELFELIKVSGQEAGFAKRDDKSWLADWIDVHKVMADILMFILEDEDLRKEVHETYRIKIRDLVSYLFTIADSPLKEHETPESSEPYHVAINSVRGRAYQVFALFAENDGSTLAVDTKALYEQVLKDESLAVKFMIGRYLSFFYARDKVFIGGLFAEIFPKDVSDKKDLYLAAWEGYLSNSLFEEIFIPLKPYYLHAIGLDPATYTKRKYSKGLDESLAVHLALAFLYFGLKLDDPLLKCFWTTLNAKRHEEFISFLGRSALSRAQASPDWLVENNISAERLIEFWDWALINLVEPQAFAGFGIWINPNKEVLADPIVVDKMAQTLKKSDGNINWDYGLMKRLKVFAEKDPAKTLEIISSYLLNSEGNLNQHRRAPLFSINNEIKEALRIIYKSGKAKEVHRFIDLLIEKGSRMFWGLKEIIGS